MGPILAVLEHTDQHLTDASRELATKAQSLAKALGTTSLVVAFGEGAADLLRDLDVSSGIAVGGDAVATYNSATYEQALEKLVGEAEPSLVLLANTTMGMDLAASLSARTKKPMLAYAADLQLDDTHTLVATSQVYGGKLLAEVELPLEGSIVTVIPGSWPALDSTGQPSITDVTASEASGVQVLRVMEEESGGDVDITRADILVSVGRGIQDPENLELAEELAQAIGGAVSCSRPVVDAGWLSRSHQVGKSGKTVKPKLYLALGISGAPEHLQGMKDAELIVAVNSDERAPIFDVAHFGGTADILDLMPALTERLQGRGQ